jgi:hypothetical protein
MKEKEKKKGMTVSLSVNCVMRAELMNPGVSSGEERYVHHYGTIPAYW